MNFCPALALTDTIAVSASSAQFASIESGKRYWFIASTACYIAQGASPTASAADGSCFVPAGLPVLIDGDGGAKVAVVRSSADGFASLAPARNV